MSKETVKMCELGKMPWFHIEGGRLSPESKKAADEVFLSLGGRVFFQAVEPMKAVRDVLLTSFAHSVPNECAFCKKLQSRSKCPRRGWGELCSEMILFAKKGRDMATIWLAGESAVEKIATAIRKVSGFGGKGFRRNPRWLQSPFGANLTLFRNVWWRTSFGTTFGTMICSERAECLR